MAVLPKALTLEEFLALPERELALEFEDGEVTQKVSPKGKHSALQFSLAAAFNRFAEPLKLARAFPELRVSFDGASRVPDIALYRWERIPLDPNGEVADDFFLPPDLVVEIVSPKQGVNPLIRRCLWYVARGVHVALLVDPGDKSIVLFRPNQIPRALRDRDVVDIGDVLPGFMLTVAAVFAALRLAEEPTLSPAPRRATPS
jgi:Uma2 family endonuclease